MLQDGGELHLDVWASADHQQNHRQERMEIEECWLPPWKQTSISNPMLKIKQKTAQNEEILDLIRYHNAILFLIDESMQREKRWAIRSGQRFEGSQLPEFWNFNHLVIKLNIIFKKNFKKGENKQKLVL